jgi:hypothetical protein
LQSLVARTELGSRLFCFPAWPRLDNGLVAGIDRPISSVATLSESPPMLKSLVVLFARLAGMLGLAAGLTACSAQQTYGVGQGWQRAECNKLPDAEQRQRCMASAAMSFDEYQRQSSAAKGAK